jgi:hypothetical protein
MLPLGCATPLSAVIAGVSIQKTEKYRPQIWAGWSLIIIGLGLLSTLEASTSTGKIVGYQIIAGFGFGFIFSSLYFPVLAPQKLNTISYALSFFAFLRLFAQVGSLI